MNQHERIDKAVDLLIAKRNDDFNAIEILNVMHIKQLANFTGKTPWATIGSYFSEQVRNPNSRYIRTSKGRYAVKPEHIVIKEPSPLFKHVMKSTAEHIIATAEREIAKMQQVIALQKEMIEMID